MSTWKVPLPFWTTPPEDAVEFREALSRYLGDFLEKRMRQAHPFDRLPEYLQYNLWLQERLRKYEDQLDDTKIQEIQTAHLWRQKYQVMHMLVGRKYEINYNKRYREICDDFAKWVFTQTFEPPPFEFLEKLNINSLTKSGLKSKLQGFEFSRQYSKYGMVVFIKKIIHDYEVVLTVDKGKMQTFFNVYIGLIRPYCGIPLGQFGFGSEPLYFSTKEKLLHSLDLIAEYVNFFTPHFEDCIKKAQDEVDGILPKREFDFG
jgi:hypothetical protein